MTLHGNTSPGAPGDMEAVGRALAKARGYILDVRGPDAFAAGHLPGAVNIPLPMTADAGELGDLLPSVLLPPRGAPLLVTDDDPGRLRRVLEVLESRDREDITGLALPGDWPAGAPADLVETGPGARALWRPDPWLERHADVLPDPSLGPALDLACGSGRSAVWLALRGYAVTGIDRLPDALELGRLLAARHEVACAFKSGDLRDLRVVPPGPWSVITIFRYLQRELIEHARELLAPGGVFLMRTFLDLPGWDGKPSRRHRLRPGELPGYFTTPEFTILAYEEGRDPDGRPAAGIVARRE